MCNVHECQLPSISITFYVLELMCEYDCECECVCVGVRVLVVIRFGRVILSGIRRNVSTLLPLNYIII